MYVDTPIVRAQVDPVQNVDVNCTPITSSTENGESVLMSPIRVQWEASLDFGAFVEVSRLVLKSAADHVWNFCCIPLAVTQTQWLIILVLKSQLPTFDTNEAIYQPSNTVDLPQMCLNFDQEAGQYVAAEEAVTGESVAARSVGVSRHLGLLVAVSLLFGLV